MLKRVFKGKLVAMSATVEEDTIQLNLLIDNEDSKQNIVVFVTKACADTFRIGQQIEALVASDARSMEDSDEISKQESTELNEEIDTEDTNTCEVDDIVGKRNLFTKVRSILKH